MSIPRSVMPNSGSPGTRPRVLLADDHPHVLESASRLLSADFRVVGAVSSGREAVDAARRLDPDVIVLDIAMPELDGFQTIQELRRIDSRATVVFLSSYRTDHYIAAALQSGVRGYVLKTRMYSDLITAVDHALAGRLFVPSLRPLSASAAGGGHSAHFHLDNRAFLDEIGPFVLATLESRESVVIVGTDATRLAVAHHLKSSGMDLEAMERRRQYAAVDAGQSLAEVMRDDQPDGDRLAEIVDGLERSRRAFAEGPESRLTIFGEMAVPLCRAGNLEAALEVERIWNTLTRPLPFFTVCSYPIECFQHGSARQMFPSLCAEHWAITHSDIQEDGTNGA